MRKCEESCHMRGMHSALLGNPGTGILVVTYLLIGILPLLARFLPFPSPNISCFLKMSFVMRFPDKHEGKLAATTALGTPGWNTAPPVGWDSRKSSQVGTVAAFPHEQKINLFEERKSFMQRTRKANLASVPCRAGFGWGHAEAQTGYAEEVA